jgi:hypothetical protein
MRHAHGSREAKTQAVKVKVVAGFRGVRLFLRPLLGGRWLHLHRIVDLCRSRSLGARHFLWVRSWNGVQQAGGRTSLSVCVCVQ